MQRAYRRQLYEQELLDTEDSPFMQDFPSRFKWTGRISYIIAVCILLTGFYVTYNRLTSDDESSFMGYYVGGGNPASNQKQEPPSAGIVRVSQFDPSEYGSAEELATWKGSSCSAAALTSALRTRGYNVHITDILNKLGDSQISPRFGLLWPHSDGLASVARSFGVQANRRELTYADLKTETALTHIVLVDIIDPQRFPGGHWLMITHADADGLRVTDSWPTNIQWLSLNDFAAIWHGNGVVIQ